VNIGIVVSNSAQGFSYVGTRQAFRWLGLPKV